MNENIKLIIEIIDIFIGFGFGILSLLYLISKELEMASLLFIMSYLVYIKIRLDKLIDKKIK